MRHLAGIIADNNAAVAKAKAEDNHNRDCSFAGDFESGIVLHSARERSTLFLRPGDRCKSFLRRWNLTDSQKGKNALVESYFANPRAQRLV